MNDRRRVGESHYAARVADNKRIADLEAHRNRLIAAGAGLGKEIALMLKVLDKIDYTQMYYWHSGAIVAVVEWNVAVKNEEEKP